MNIPRPIMFCIVGGTGVLVNTGVLYICKEYAGFPLLLSSVVAIGVAMLWNFYWNDIWTFSSTKTENLMHDRLFIFLALCSVGVLLNAAILLFLANWGVYYLLANLAGIGAATGWNYVMNKRVTWG